MFDTKINNQQSVNVEAQAVLYPISRLRALSAGKAVVSLLEELVPRVAALDLKRGTAWEEAHPFPSEDWWNAQEALHRAHVKWEDEVEDVQREIKRSKWYPPFDQLQRLRKEEPPKPAAKWDLLSQRMDYFGRHGRGRQKPYVIARLDWRRGGPDPQLRFLEDKLRQYKPELSFLGFVDGPTVLVPRDKVELYSEWESQAVVERWESWLSKGETNE